MSHVPYQSHFQPGFIRGTAASRAAKRFVVLAGAALFVAGCGEAQQTAEELRSKTDAAVDAKGVADAIRSSVNEEAIEGTIKGAAAGAIREELGAVGDLIDEDALVSGIDKAIDGQGVTSAVGQAARDVARGSAPSAEEQTTGN